MQINLTGHHVDVSAKLKEHVETKLARVARHFDHATSAHVVLSVQKQTRRAEATINVPGGQLFADATNSDMHAAVDALVDKLDRQIKRHKEKLSDHHPRGSAAKLEAG